MFVSSCVECTGESSGGPSSDGTSIPSVLEGGEGGCVRDVKEALRAGIMIGGLWEEAVYIP